MEILEYYNKSSFINEVSHLICEISEKCISDDGIFRLVLAGGETPISIYKQLKSIETDWSKWVFYFSDERCDSGNSEHLNFTMAANALLSHIPIQANQVYKIDTFLGAIEAANRYNEILKNVVSFDLVLLGLGEDGHTASLFPGNYLGEDVSAANSIAVFNSPKQPPERVSLSLRRINSSDRIVFLVSGDSKKQIIENLKKGDDLPASKVKGRIFTKMFFLTENQ
ncbi:6-phosphogluconolactonase [Leptospira vanthielii]|uniref:6-phosphogluconolactonase n=1 Tax=Leptospira vanthielii TaxID=293085 RepID=A0ABY2NT27_9LEPT|nr:6-phosphogluconolactonase [Leptospira vanthielii]TGM60683.1 6-phosphogluconolactonase [Leptospira vanthielii]